MSHQPAPFTRLVTGHDPKPSSDPTFPNEPSTVFHPSSGEAPWQQIMPTTFFSLVYTSDSRPDMTKDADVGKYDETFASGKLGLVNPAGSVCRVVEWAPRDPDAEIENTPFMHRTQSLDYGIVLHGEVELTLPDEQPRVLRQGDICVQRGTLHSWRNNSTKDSARMVFVLIASEQLAVGDKKLEEYLPPAPPELGGTTTAELLQAKKN